MQHDQKGQAYYSPTPTYIWEIPDQQWEATEAHMAQLEYKQGSHGICG